MGAHQIRFEMGLVGTGCSGRSPGALPGPGMGGPGMGGGGGGGGT